MGRCETEADKEESRINKPAPEIRCWRNKKLITFWLSRTVHSASLHWPAPHQIRYELKKDKK